MESLPVSPSISQVNSIDVPTIAKDKEVEGVRGVEVGKDLKEIEDRHASDPSDDFPDGGTRAWLVTLGTMLTGFATFGFVNSWGVFQSFYEENLLKGTSPSSIAWIGSIQYALIFLPGLLTGRMFDIGIFKIPFAIASVVIVASCFIIAECTKHWHFLLVQGIVFGLASGTVFGPSMGIIGHWFKKRRGLALGITSLGSSIGGTIIPIAARRLIEEVGFKWTMRIIGFILLAVMTVPNLTLRRRLPPKRVSGGIFNPHIFLSPVFSLYCLAIWVSFLGLYTVLTYIDISAIRIGISSDFSFYLVSIGNAASLVGRLLSALMVDRCGPINFYAPMTLCAGILTYSWPFARSQASLIVVAILYGFFSGAFVATFVLPVYEMGEIDDVGRRTGTIMSIAAIGALIGPPISGAINDASGGFEAVGYYAGSMIVLSCALMLFARHVALRRLVGKF
ncbi:hypothetical protein V5O48_002624 [Marasmius crinis-equi]|uniref:Major facilitator superfamily (MFS) profile domain-containing protein n=1 Tax=Marasmius crinis-equi TaxID=585013 RepID=A0ABR3FW98_9AGAR